MSKTRYSIQTARSCFRTWRNAPRMLVLLGMIACFTIIYVIPFAENAQAMGGLPCYVFTDCVKLYAEPALLTISRTG